MINTGKCPKCDAVVQNVEIEDVTVNVSFTPAWKGISDVCPRCRSILSIQIDPVALKTDIINAVVQALRR